MSAVFRARCGKCGITQVYEGDSLEFVRMQCCPDCRVRMTVVGHEETPIDLPVVETPPQIERCVITDRRNDIARGLVESALGGK